MHLHFPVDYFGNRETIICLEGRNKELVRVENL